MRPAVCSLQVGVLRRLPGTQKLTPSLPVPGAQHIAWHSPVRSLQFMLNPRTCAIPQDMLHPTGHATSHGACSVPQDMFNPTGQGWVPLAQQPVCTLSTLAVVYWLPCPVRLRTPTHTRFAPEAFAAWLVLGAPGHPHVPSACTVCGQAVLGLECPSLLRHPASPLLPLGTQLPGHLPERPSPRLIALSAGLPPGGSVFSWRHSGPGGPALGAASLEPGSGHC